MNPVYNTPNWAFLVQVTRPNGAHVEYQYIEQLITHPTHSKCLERVQNQVNGRLDALSRRTGLSYFVVAEGPPETVKRIMKDQKIEVS